MTAEEHAHVQELGGLVKRYRSRIVQLKAEVERLQGLLVIFEDAYTTVQQRLDALSSGMPDV